MKNFAIAAALTVFAAPAFAQEDMITFQGDAAAGEEQFNRQCVACHVVQDPETDEVLAGRNAKVGPNLYGVAGRQLGVVEDFNYSDSIVELGETGQIWTEEAFVGYVQDPTGWLREELDNRRARGKMAYQVRQEDEAYDLYAFLATFGDQEAQMEALQAAAEGN
ncbi:c-type cytochrome [Loktanella sp. SALINAS62]|uniref:c-type cytochrome n=1 Tax=Loktanella sp. SALINAS62 TaxID=2706124 RepID=UPI001B8B0397|nr:c-type cytochrome [Loktanella sp. SALINAS62]MBS1302282.1 c-type cytochrome [Loktanella sp. SALINAS62]